MISVDMYRRIADRWERAAVRAGFRTELGKSYRATRAAPYNAAEAGIMLRGYYPGATAVVFTLHEDPDGVSATIKQILGANDQVLYDGDSVSPDDYFDDEAEVGDPLATAALQLIKRGNGRNNLGQFTSDPEENFDDWVRRLAKTDVLFRSNDSGMPNLGTITFRYDLPF
jgi:hypothetical protein